MDWWSELKLATTVFLDQHGLLAGFVFLLIEEAGVPVPVPGDFLMLLLGVRAAQGLVGLWQAIAVVEAGTVVGATFLYTISRLAGRTLVYRYGRFIRLTPSRLDRAEAWLRRRGFLAVILGRLFPGLRIVTAVGCGVFSVPFRVFEPAMALGALLYIVGYTLLGYFAGPPVLTLLEHVNVPVELTGSLILLALWTVWVVRARRALWSRSGEVTDGAAAAAAGGGQAGHEAGAGSGLAAHLAVPELSRRRRMRSGAVAGGLATLVSTMVMNVLAHFGGSLALQAPDTFVQRAATRLPLEVAVRGGPLLLILIVPLFFSIGVLWGMAYGMWGEPRLATPDWLGGLAFAAIPLATSLLIAMPLLGFGVFGFEAGVVDAVEETVRHAVYGLALGLAYPIFLWRQQSRARQEETPGTRTFQASADGLPKVAGAAPPAAGGSAPQPR